MHQSKPYYPVPNATSGQQYAFIPNDKIVILATEANIKSLIEQGDKVSSPAVDLSFLPTVPDVVLAVVPKDRKALFGAAPNLNPAGAGLMGLGGPNAGAGPGAAGDAPLGSGKGNQGPNAPGRSFTLSGDDDDDDGRGGTIRSQPTPSGAQSTDELGPLLETHAEAVALLLDFDADVKLDVALRCNDPAAATKLRALFAKSVGSAKESLNAAREFLPGVIHQIAEAVLTTVTTGGQAKVVTISATLPETQRTNLTMLPAAVMGLMMAQSGMAMSPDAMIDWQARADEVRNQGQPPVSAESLPNGLELRALARWGVPPAGGIAPPLLEIALVATGELTKNAVAFGNLQVNEIDVGAGPRLKWLGASGVESGSDPIRDFAPIDRGFFTRHPEDGVAFGFAFASTGSLPRSLSAFAGNFTFKKATGAREVVLQRLHETLDPTADEVLRNAILIIVPEPENGMLAVSIQHEPTPKIGKIEILDAGGNPLDVISESQISGGTLIERKLYFSGDTKSTELGVRVTIHDDVEEIPVSFRFEDLALPEHQDSTTGTPALAMWKAADRVSSQVPAGLFIDAQARWHSPYGSTGAPISGGTLPPFAGPNQAPARGLLGGRDDDGGRGFRRPNEPIEDDDDGRGSLIGRGPNSGGASGGPRPGAGARPQPQATGRRGLGAAADDDDDSRGFGGGGSSVPAISTTV
ncbi:MAG: hypothetical protein KF861_23130, partial [Planctomycetaceae bacterium]|nr:hypothetical protein [Planctomycetaceae bacterium]